MAEVLGVVASGIAVVDAAGQVGSGIIKLRRLWSQVKDVPDTVNSLMQQLELLAVVIGEMETIYQSSPVDASRPFNSQGMQLSMTRCREAMDALEDLVNRLTQHVDSQKRFKRAKAKLKVALGKDDLDQCHSRLNNAVQLLQVAQGCFQMSVNGAMLRRLIALPTQLESRAEPEIVELESSAIGSQLEARSKETKSSMTDEIGMSEVRTRATLVHKASWSRSWHSDKQSLGPFASYAWDSSEIRDDDSGFIQKGLYFRFELAQWLSGKAWEIQAIRAMSGWHHHLKTYNIVPSDSEVMRCIWKGDLERIKYLFQNNLASIHDHDVDGRSLLSNAVFATRWGPDNAEPWHDVVKFFHGCDMKFPETGHDVAALVLCFTEPHWDAYMPWLLTCWESAEDFIHSAGTNMMDLVTIAGCTYTAFTTLQPVTEPDFYHSPLVERVRKISLHGPTCDHRVFRKFLHEDAIIKRDDAVEIARGGINILSLATRSFVESRNYNNGQYDQAGWNKLMQELVLKTGDFNLEQEAYSHYDIKGLHKAEARSGNPFMVCILSAIHCFPIRRFHSRKVSLERHLHTEVHRWLQVLQDCEIDLKAYGQREHGMIFRKGKRPRLIHGYKETWLWTGFSWGSNPSNWVFHIDRVVERFSGDFWRLIDNPIQQVPGAWIEDEDLHSDLSDSELEDDLDDDSE